MKARLFRRAPSPPSRRQRAALRFVPLSAPAVSPPVIGATTLTSGTSSGGTPNRLTSASHTVSASTDILYFLIAHGHSSYGPITAASWNGQSASFVGRHTGTVWAAVEIWRIVNPTPGSGTAYIDFTEAVTEEQANFLLVNAENCSTTELGTFAYTNGTNAASPRQLTGIPAAVGDIILGVYADDEGSAGVLGVQALGDATQLAEVEDMASDSDYGWQKKTATSTSETIGWTVTHEVNGDHVIAAIAVKSLSGDTLEPRYGRPISTAEAGAWTAVGAATHHEAVNEVEPDDNDYISVGAPGEIIKFPLTVMGDPGSTLHVLMVRAASTFSNSARFSIRQGATTELAAWTQAVTATPTQYDFSLTTGERDSITDYTTLQLWIESL